MPYCHTFIFYRFYIRMVSLQVRQLDWNCVYHWRELPQVSVLSRQRFCRAKGFVAPNMYLSFVASKVCLSRQKVCREILICHNKHDFIATSILLSRQTCVCGDKTRLLAREKYARRGKLFSRQTQVLSRQP